MINPRDLPNIMLIGRTNVGKSTLFNRLTESKKAIVSTIAGTTRDKNEGICEWDNYMFRITDTGGVDLTDPSDIDEKVIESVWEQIAKADIILFVVDARAGVLPNDQQLALNLRKKGIEFTIVANKADNMRMRDQSLQFAELHPHIIPVSAANGSGTNDLLDWINEELAQQGKQALSSEVESLEEKIAKEKEQDISLDEALNQDIDLESEVEGLDLEDPFKHSKKQDIISIAFVGMPNVGKSSLMNSFLGRNEVIVSSQAHTTREARDIFFDYKGQQFRLIDTAGIRKKRKMRTFLMKESADRTLKAIKEADWVIFLIDAKTPKWGEQDQYILNELILSGKAIIMGANKWDLLNGEMRFEEFKDRWTRSFFSKYWIPVLPISAKTGWHINKLLDKILELEPNRHRVINRSGLESFIKSAIKRRRPQKSKGPQAPYIHTIKQIDTAPPTFELVIDHSNTLAESYVRFIKKSLRFKFDFEAVPIRIYVRSVKS